MPIANLNDVDIYYEDDGIGTPVIFLHEYCADLRSWDEVAGALSHGFRCIRPNFRGYPPSTTSSDSANYSSDLLVGDLEALLLYLNIKRAHIVGVATGGGIALNLAIRRPDLVDSLVLIGLGAGSNDREQWLTGAGALAKAIAEEGIPALVKNMLAAPQRQALKLKNPIAWEKFIQGLGGLSQVGMSLTMTNVLMARRPLQDLVAEICEITVPTLVVLGDQDAPAFESCLFLRRSIKNSALYVLPLTGHMVPVEEPAQLSAALDHFLTAIDKGRWGNWLSTEAAN